MAFKYVLRYPRRTPILALVYEPVGEKKLEAHLDSNLAQERPNP